MEWQTLANALFPQGHGIAERDRFLAGEAQVDGRTVAVIGTTGHAPIGIEIALAQAQAVLATVREHPGRPIVMLVDTQGQRLRHRDEMLGINSYMAHLGKCVDLARRRGHRIVALVYDQALSGGFITSGLMADACYALPAATIRVMGLAAMARITKVPEDTLADLARSNPVFAPGPENYLRMGGLQAIWDGDLAASLAEALRAEAAPRAASGKAPDAVPHAAIEAAPNALPNASSGAGVRPDRRAALGLERGGRKLAHSVIQAILGGHRVQAP